MLKELRELHKENAALEKYIRMIQNKGILPKHVSENGYAAYDTDEYAQHKKTARRGRPVKLQR